MAGSHSPAFAMNQARGHAAHVLITGASSGIGAELARLYAGRRALVSLQGRSTTRLAQVAEQCRALGAVAETGAFDVRDRAALQAWLKARNAAQPVDLLIANAGIAGSGSAPGTREAPPGEEDSRARTIMEVNVLGLIDTVEALLPAMMERRRGHIALMASLASYRGYATAPAYAASKAAIRVYGQGMRARLRPAGIQVSTIFPGFVETPLTAENPFPMPFLMSGQRAAGIIAAGLDRGRAKIAFPWTTHLLARLGAILPDALVDRVASRAGVKE